MMNAELRRILEPAYHPCGGFDGKCKGLIYPFNPASGHVPRGFYGALGDLSEVRLVMVLAEPTGPGIDEDHTRGIDSAFAYAGRCYRYGNDPGHANTRSIIQKCFLESSHWTDQAWREAMRKVWITNSVLCTPTAAKYRDCEDYCGKEYLLRQLRLFSHAVIAAMGTRAHERIKRLRWRFPPASNIKKYISPYYQPGWNSPSARASWNTLVGDVAKMSP